MGKTKRYIVGTFANGTRKPNAYLRTYNPAWEGCLEYVIEAESGADAKKLAIEMRQRFEKEKEAER